MTKKVRINKAIFGKKVFKSRIELEFYRRYEKMKLDRRLIYDTHTAVGIVEGYIPAKDAHEEIEAWQHLIDTGVCWELQGWFGRTAQSLIEGGICKEKTVN